jgi:hypothetical protein
MLGEVTRRAEAESGSLWTVRLLAFSIIGLSLGCIAADSPAATMRASELAAMISNNEFKNGTPVRVRSHVYFSYPAQIAMDTRDVDSRHFSFGKVLDPDHCIQMIFRSPPRLRDGAYLIQGQVLDYRTPLPKGFVSFQILGQSVEAVCWENPHVFLVVNKIVRER